MRIYLDPRLQLAAIALAANLPFTEFVKTVERCIIALVQEAEAVAACEAPEADDYSSLSTLLHALQNARHSLKSSLSLHFDKRLNGFGPGPDEFLQAQDKQRALIDSLNEAGHMIRPIFDETVRPLIRPRNILELPPELLTHIFSFFKFYDGQLSSPLFVEFEHYGRNGDNIRDLQNIRLSCGQFYGASSCFLLDSVDVGLNGPDLAHLEEISRHPYISKGIKAVRVNLDMYHPSFPDEELFLIAACQALDETIIFNVTQLGQWDRDPPPSAQSIYTLEKMKEMTELNSRTFSIYERHLTKLRQSQNDPADEPADEHARKSIAAFRLAFAQFVNLAREQHDVVRRGTFVKTVAQAMARMPTATKLILTDTNILRASQPTRSPTWGPTFDNFHLSMEMARNPFLYLRDRLIRTSSWKDSPAPQALPLRLLHELPVEIAKAGTTLTHFENQVLVPSIGDLDAALSQQDISVLSSIGQTLRVFYWDGRGILEPEVDESGFIKFGGYLRALATGKKLQRLSIKAEFARKVVSMRSFFTPTTRLSSNLKVCVLTGCAFHLRDLSAFLSPYGHKSLFAQWTRICLLSGSWADALDILRAKFDWHSTLAEAGGAECASMSNEEAALIFRYGSIRLGDINEATKYIQSGHPERDELKNPLRPIEAEVEESEDEKSEDESSEDENPEDEKSEEEQVEAGGNEGHNDRTQVDEPEDDVL